MKQLNYTNRSAASKLTGLSYLGNVNSSSKMIKNSLYNELTYILYLAPADLSGYEACPMRTPECTALCLNTSGRVKMDKKNIIVNSRIAKTKLFFEHREFFMRWMIDEIEYYKNKAKKQDMNFSVRLNGTSDISINSFHLVGTPIPEIFPDVQFYDYTKVPNRFNLTEKFENYDLTFSYSGHNMDICLDLLSNKKARVAMVFEKDIPDTYMGFEVVNGDNYDMRYIDPIGSIVGLKFKKVKGNPSLVDNKFVIKND